MAIEGGRITGFQELLGPRERLGGYDLTDEARKSLQDFEREHGREAVERIIQQIGPNTPPLHAERDVTLRGIPSFREPGVFVGVTLTGGTPEEGGRRILTGFDFSRSRDVDASPPVTHRPEQGRHRAPKRPQGPPDQGRGQGHTPGPPQ